MTSLLARLFAPLRVFLATHGRSRPPGSGRDRSIEARRGEAGASPRQPGAWGLELVVTARDIPGHGYRLARIPRGCLARVGGLDRTEIQRDRLGVGLAAI